MENEVKKRVKEELTELSDRHDKLGLFIGNEKFKNLDKTSRILLVVQYNIMSAYINILKTRLECWNDE